MNEDVDFDLIEDEKLDKDRKEEGQVLVNHVDQAGESERSKKEKEEEAEIFRLIGMKKGGMEEITFELNGKRETFYVARQVDATLDDLPIEEDESFYSKVT